jgi:eukaryotic-like serine/threonine-protein kinase
MQPGSQPRLPTAAPYGPAPNPYQSQMYPPLPATQPHGRRERGGTMPAIAVTPQMPLVAPAQSSHPNTGTTPTAQSAFRQTSNGLTLPRIMVQYPQIGSKLTGMRGTYEVRNVIGAGEFGAVYECIGPFDQIYAVKMVRPSNRPYSEVHAEWAREVQRLFSLRHPNVVYIYDSFTHDHLFYLALERCDHPLKVMLGTPMQEGLVIEMSRQLLAAVQFLHDNDVVHDDLHAGNVLITHTDRPTVKISDFGISHELRGMAAVRPNIVHHAIMAPEILATGYTSRQSDLYQVGLLIYWMLTGESAMQMDVPYQELVRQVAEGEPRKRAEALGIPLGDLIAKMLRRREAFRYTSAREVWEDMRQLPEWKQRDLFPAK